MRTKTTILGGLAAIVLAGVGYLAYDVGRPPEPVEPAAVTATTAIVPYGIAAAPSEAPPGIVPVARVTPPLPTMPPSVPEHPDTTPPPSVPPELAAHLEQRAP